MRKPLRVGMICPYSISVPGGVQDQVLGLSRVMRRRGLDVRVLAPSDGPPPEPGITTLGASLPTAANGSIAPIAPDIPAQIRLIKAIWNEEFDLLHLHEPIAPGVGITTVLMQAAPMIGTFHAAGRSSAYRLANRACRALRRRLDLACAVSEEAEELAATWLGGTYERVFNGVDIERFVSAQPYPREQPTIFFLGRHEERKGLHVLLAALDDVGDDVRVWVGSDGPESAALRTRFSHDRRIEWLGRISDADKLSRLAGADVICAPSLGGESFGIVLLEAMAAGTPIVASDIAGYAKVARHDVDALLVEPGAPRALAAALLASLGGGAAVERRIAAGRDRVAEFSMSALADLYEEKYERVLGAAPA